MKTAGTIKLFVDAHVFDGKYQGSRSFIKGIYSNFAANKDVHLFLGAYDLNNLEENFPASANITYIKYKSSSAFIRLLYDIPAIIKKHRIDYAHLQYITPIIKNCRFIITTHDLLFNDYPGEFPFIYRLVRNFLFKRAVRRANIVTTVSEYSKRSIQECFKTSAEHIHIIPNGIHPFYFNDYDKQDSRNYIKDKYGVEKIILLVSRVEPRKNHLLLVKAFIELKLFEQGYNLVLIGGECIPTPALDGMLNEMPTKAKLFVLILKDVDEKDLLEFYRAAEVFVYPSKAEGFGIPPLEAAAAKVPVLCSNSTAMKDFCFFEQDHFDPGNFPVFKNKLAATLNTKPDISELVRRASIIKQKYNWQTSADLLYELIKKDELIR